MKNRRFKFQFSLRSLLLLVLLLASSAALWWNWGPWGVALRIVEDGAVGEVCFTPDDRLLVIRSTLAIPGLPEQFVNVVTVRDAQTGKIIRSWRGGDADSGRLTPDNLELSPGGQYAILHVHEYHREANGNSTLVPRDRCWRIADGEEIDFSKQFIQGPFFQIKFSRRDSFASLFYEGQCVLVKMPEKRVLTRQKSTSDSIFSDDEQSFALSNYDQVAIYSTDTGDPTKYLSGLKIELGAKRFSPDNRYLAVETYSHAMTYVFDLSNGKSIYYSGKLPLFTSDYRLVFQNNGEINRMTVRRINEPEEQIHLNALPLRVQGNVIFGANPFSAWDSRTGRELWNEGATGCISYDGKVAACKSELLRPPDCLREAETGRELFRFSSWRWRRELQGPACELSFSNTSGAFVMYPNTFWNLLLSNEPPPGDRRVIVWRQFRPAHWYGLAWLPEFWLTTVIAAAFLWSVWPRGPIKLRDMCDHTTTRDQVIT